MNSDRADSRLKNIKAIKPLITALKTLSLGSWQSALNKISGIQQFEEKFNPILLEILPHIKIRKPGRFHKQKQKSQNKAIILIIGSERGLCGKFNMTLSDKALSWINTQDFSSYQIWAMGSSMIQHLERSGIPLTWKNPLQSSFFSSYSGAYLLTLSWLERFEAYEFDHLFLILNQLIDGDTFQFTTQKLIPHLTIDPPEKKSNARKPWPPPIIETDPRGIYNQIINQRMASSFFLALQKSLIAENSYRYNRLQDAEENAEDIIQDLKTLINTRRKNRITQEMQELASGAGLLDN